MTGFVPPEGLTDFIVIFFPPDIKMAVGSVSDAFIDSFTVPST